MQTQTSREAGQVPEPLRWLTALEAAAFLFFALLHLGVRVLPIPEPRILPATVVETSAGLALGMSACGAFAQRGWARAGTIAATIFSIAGVLLGIAALADGRGPQSAINFVYHRTMLAVLIGSLALLLIWRPRTGGVTHESAA
jgi:hypothetical protein